jgi:dTDP-glucose 4,6-dehydratase
MKIAILGGGSCFALNLARYLSECGIEHFGIGRSPRKPPALWPIEHHYRYHALHVVDQLQAVMAVLDTEKPDVIVNFAAQGEGAASFGANAADFFRTNAWGLSRFVLEIQKRDYLERFIHIGSSEVYGSPEQAAKESDLLDPTSPYSASKAAFDHYLNSMWRTQKFAMNIVRPSNCYTPGQQLHRIIPKAIICALKGEKLQLHGGGMAQKSYLHSTDLSRAILKVAERAHLGQIYNVGPDEPVTIRSAVELVANCCGVKFADLVDEAPERMGQDARYYLDCSKAKRELEWQQTIELEGGIAMMADWVKAHPELLQMSTAYQHRL